MEASSCMENNESEKTFLTFQLKKIYFSATSFVCQKFDFNLIHSVEIMDIKMSKRFWV